MPSSKRTSGLVLSMFAVLFVGDLVQEGRSRVKERLNYRRLRSDPKTQVYKSAHHVATFSEMSTWPQLDKIAVSYEVNPKLQSHETRQAPKQKPTTEKTQVPPDKGSIIPSFLVEADQLECARKLNIKFTELFREIKLGRLRRCRLKERCGLCRNPTVPSEIFGRYAPRWQEFFEDNRKMAAKAPRNLDVVLLGDSITYNWKSIGHKVWREYFEGHALPLGIGGDSANELLYRMLHGELPLNIQPRAWSVLIGSNDYTLKNCNKETVLVGNLAVVDLLLQRKQNPAPRIILNHLLPRGRNMPLPTQERWHDFMWVSERLQCLAELTGFEFFNGTSFFLTNDGTEINQTLMYDYIHPSSIGYEGFGLSLIGLLREAGLWRHS